MNCPSCNSDWMTTALQGGVVVIKCGACGCRVQSPSGSQPESSQRPPQSPKAQPAPQPTAQPRKRREKAPQPDTPLDPVPALRARLKWLDGEIKRLRKLEAEREQLARILSAASGPPVAVVRELKRSHA